MNECDKCPIWKTCTDKCLRIQKLKKLMGMESKYRFSFEEKAYYSLSSKGGINIYFTVDAYEKVEQVTEGVFKAIEFSLRR